MDTLGWIGLLLLLGQIVAVLASVFQLAGNDHGWVPSLLGS